MKEPTLPHILLLMTDQFRHDAFAPEITPNLFHRLSRNKNNYPTTTVTFANAYSSTPTCTPARAALLTGKSPWSHGMLSYSTYTDCTSYPTTLPRVLKEWMNYTTAAIGKNHFGPIKHVQGYQDEILYEGLDSIDDDYDAWFAATYPHDVPDATCDLGWNSWMACPYQFEEYAHPTTWTTRTALQYLENYFDNNDDDESDDATPINTEKNPLFLKLSYHRPHSPYDPPQRLLEAYLNDDHTKSHLPQLERFVNASSWDRKYRDHPMEHDAFAGDPGPIAARYSRAAYLANAEFVDEGVGQILDFLDDHSKEDFLIVWTSDHGDMNGDHFLWRKMYPWEASAHIPMVIRMPQSWATSSSSSPPSATTEAENINQATQSTTYMRSDALVENRDIAPTIYEMIGVLDRVQEIDPLVNGISLLPILEKRTKQVRDFFDLEHGAVYNETLHWNALLGTLAELQETENGCDKWKYIFQAYDGSEMLFCLSSDPTETNDLSKTRLDVAAIWRSKMVKQFESEDRGPEWVLDGELQIRTRSILYGDNFPCQHASVLGMELIG